MSSESERREDAAFERRLLESARGDARPHEVRQAWARFANRLAVFDPDARRDLERPGGRDRAPATIAARPAGIRATWHVAAKWLLLGAISGGGLTAGLMTERRHPGFDPPSSESPAAVPTRRAGDPRSALEPTVSPADDRGPALGARRPRPRPGHQTDRTAPHGVGPSHRTARSTLAAEVSRIDGARTALSIGDYVEALRLIERYHDDFPEGALAPDAEVVALEAVAAQHDQAETTRLARRFLSRHPNDPHAARVTWLADHVREPR